MLKEIYRTRVLHRTDSTQRESCCLWYSDHMQTAEPPTFEQAIAETERKIVALATVPGPVFGDGPPPPPCFCCGRYGVHTWLCTYTADRRAEL